MEFHEIRLLLDLPAAKLLRSPNAAMILGFFDRAFKRQHRVSIVEGQLRAMLENYLEELREADPEAYPQTARQYLESWCDESHGFLKKYYDDEEPEPVFELTSGSEKSLVWVESLKQSEFVGTETRLESIFKGLDDILKFASGNAEERIRSLREEKAVIEEEIGRIEATGTASVFTPVQINERFGLVLSTARDLLGDFRQVEENFKRLAQEIAERHALPGITKGAIVGHMLDSWDALRTSAQGQSFYAFWDLLLSSDRQSRFKESLEKVYALEVLSESMRSNRLLSHLISRLLDEGEKVVNSHQRMSTNLRRVLDTANLQERRRILELVHEVQAAALALKSRPPKQEGFFQIEYFPQVFSSFTRQLWAPRQVVDLKGEIEESEEALSLDELRRFRNLPQIQLRKLRENVETCLARETTVTLEQVLDRFPPKHGLVEVLGYLIIASEEVRHYIAEKDLQTIQLAARDASRWNLPRVLFSRA